jgi:hypothetical protein
VLDHEGDRDGGPICTTARATPACCARKPPAEWLEERLYGEVVEGEEIPPAWPEFMVHVSDVFETEGRRTTTARSTSAT